MVNVMKWLGQPASYADVPYWQRKLKLKRYDGTRWALLYLALHEVEGLRLVDEVGFPSMSRIDRELKRGRAIVYRTKWDIRGEQLGHVFLLTDRTDASFYACNTRWKNGWFRKTAFESYCQVKDVYLHSMFILEKT